MILEDISRMKACILLCSASQGLQQVLYCNFQFEDLRVPGPHERSHEYEPVQGMEWECMQTESTHVWHMPICGISSRKHSVCPYKLLGLTPANGYFETQHHASWHGPQCIYPNSGDDWVTFPIQYASSRVVYMTQKNDTEFKANNDHPAIFKMVAQKEGSSKFPSLVIVTKF